MSRQCRFWLPEATPEQALRSVGFLIMANPDTEAVAGPLSLTRSQWWRVLGGVRATAERTNLALIAGGVAFFGLLAIVPALAALATLIGLIGDASVMKAQVEALAGVAPDAVVLIITDQVERLIAARDEALLASSLFNLALAFWSALQGTRWTLLALTAVNRRAEQRRGLRRWLNAGLFTIYGLALSVVAILLMGFAPIALTFMQTTNALETLLLVLRWPVLGGAAIAVALMLYRWGPRRRPPPWRWLWPGAIVAPVLWVIASSALTFALREFPAFGAAYGSLASVLALLLWLYVTALIFLLGGALNAELEFFAQGKPAPPVTPDEYIEPEIVASGEPKQTTP